MARPAWRIHLPSFTGSGYLNQMDANGGYVLHVDFRVKWNKWQNCLVLTYKSANGTWDEHDQEEIQNFCFRAGTDIKIKVEATPCSFRITVLLLTTTTSCLLLL